MIEIMRWFSLGLSLISLGIASYSYWYALRVNKMLSRKNLNLLAENSKLNEKIEDYEGEILRLRTLLKSKEKQNETDAL